MSRRSSVRWSRPLLLWNLPCILGYWGRLRWLSERPRQMIPPLLLVKKRTPTEGPHMIIFLVRMRLIIIDDE